MRMMICLDGSTLSSTVLPSAMKLAQAAGADVELVRVIDPSRAHATLAGVAFAGSLAGSLGSRVGQAGGTLLAPLTTGREATFAREPRVLETRGQALVRAEEDARAELERTRAELDGPAGIVVLQGKDVTKAIIEYAGDQQIDLIAMATHSRHGAAGLLLGSVTQGVIESGVAPVVVVHPTGAASAPDGP